MDEDRGRVASKGWLTDTSRDPGLSADHIVELCETWGSLNLLPSLLQFSDPPSGPYDSQ